MNMIIRDHFLSNLFSNFENNQRYDSSYEVYENESSFDIHIELPGLKREQLSVEVHENHLKVNTRSSNINKKDETSNKRIKKYSKTFKLPKNIDQAKISSSLEDGILTLNLPKFEKQAPRTIDINVK